MQTNPAVEQNKNINSILSRDGMNLQRGHGHVHVYGSLCVAINIIWNVIDLVVQVLCV